MLYNVIYKLEVRKHKDNVLIGYNNKPRTCTLFTGNFDDAIEAAEYYSKLERKFGAVEVNGRFELRQITESETHYISIYLEKVK